MTDYPPRAPFRLLLVAACLVVLGAALSATAQDIVPPQQVPFLFRTWRREDGLPHNSVTAITQTPDGYLWLGTYGGLAQFDGVNCRVFGLKDGLRSLQVSKLLYDSHGILWIGTVGGGLSRMIQGKIETLPTSSGLASDTVNALLEDHDGTIWVGTATGLWLWKGGILSRTGTGALTNAYIRDLAMDHDGAVWIATLHQGLLRLEGDKVSTVPGPAGFRVVQADSLLVDQQNRLWAGSVTGTILCRENELWTAYTEAEGAPKTLVNELTQSTDGTIWAGTLDEGVYYLNGRRFAALREADGLASDAVNSLFADRHQLVWVGTRAGGLCRLMQRRLQNCRVIENGAERFPITLEQTTDGNFWVGTAGRGLFRWNGSEFEQFLRDPPVSGHMFVGALLAGRDGSLWWGAGPALFQWKDGKVAANLERVAWLRGDRVLSLCEDIKDGIWIGTHNGQLRHLQNGVATPIEGLGGQPVTAIVQQPDGLLWAGTLGGGLIRLQGGTQTVFTVDSGLGSDLIRTLFLDREGVLWIGTVGGGLARWKSGRLTAFTPQQGLLDDSISQILEDDTGNLWLGGDRGIMRVARKELENLATGQSTTIHPVVLGRREGMLSEQCAIGFRAAIRTRSGQLCFCTAKGIVIADPRQETAKAPPPTVLIQSVVVDGVVRTGQFQLSAPSLADGFEAAGEQPEQAEIEPGRNLFEFHYTGLSFDAPERIQFRYRLTGLNQDWVEAGKNRVASYAHIPPGDYVFQVIACNGDGVWNEVGASARFTVLPHFWQRPWFAVAAVLVCVGITAVGIRMVERRRYRNRLKRLERERAMENERARIARDLHDELGSSLTRISMLSDQMQSRADDPVQTKVLAAKLTGFSVRTTQAFEEIVWAVNPRNDSLRSLVEYLTQFANELFEESGIQCRFQFPADLPELPLPPDARHNIFLVVKEALTNALRHSGARQITLAARLDGPRFEVTVTDDGIGFDPAARATGESEHDGLANMRQRIEALGGTYQLTSAPGQGTVVRFTIPHLPQTVASLTARP